MGWNDGSLYAGRQPPAARVLIRKAGRANTGAGYRTYSRSIPNRHAPVDGNDFLMHADGSMTVVRNLPEDTLEHFGILGQKWGVRRFQNEDGTLTEAGKQRYSDSGKSEKDGWKKSDAKNLSDEELNRRNSRLQREQNYENLMTSSKERERKQLSADFKKKLFMAVAVTPVIALVGGASKKYWGAAAAKVGKVIGRYGRTAISKIKSGRLLKNLKNNAATPYAKGYGGELTGPFAHLNNRQNDGFNRAFEAAKEYRKYNYWPRGKNPLPRNAKWPNL